jgi:hypothetical protein
MKHIECAGIQVCGPETGDVDGHHCDSNECILISSFSEGEAHDSAGWNIYTHAPAGAPGGGH